ncbi:MAG TPA: DinB family protein [Mycobacteriales bacterium]|nr:DinB family protein [Mycobacteriales bacterium]
MSTPGPQVVPPLSGPERPILEGMLEWYRHELVRKIDGITEEQARARLVPSATTLGGLIKHMRWVELNWFERVLAGRPEDSFPPAPWSDDNPDGDMVLTDDETLASLFEQYWAQIATSRDIAAAMELDDTGTHRRVGEVSLRWVYVHLIEELARHAGHADILREQTDGFVGDEP